MLKTNSNSTCTRQSFLVVGAFGEIEANRSTHLHLGVNVERMPWFLYTRHDSAKNPGYTSGAPRVNATRKYNAVGVRSIV